LPTNEPIVLTVRELSHDEYRATFDQKMNRLGPDSAPPFDFWPYFEAIPPRDFGDFDCSEGNVDYVYLNSNETFSHVLINSNDRNVFMVVVLDLAAGTVHGHRLLNLKEEYGLDTAGE